jgi:hypothetical protein
MRRRVWPAFLALACAGSTACGGHTTTKKDVIAHANGICVSTLRQVREVPPPSGNSLKALGAYLAKVEPIITKQASDTRALPRPAKDRAILNRYVAAVSAGATQYRALATAARNGDSAGVSQALATLRDNPAQALAKEYGLNECIASAGTNAS